MITIKVAFSQSQHVHFLHKETPREIETGDYYGLVDQPIGKASCCRKGNHTSNYYALTQYDVWESMAAEMWIMWHGANLEDLCGSAVWRWMCSGVVPRSAMLARLAALRLGTCRWRLCRQVFTTSPMR